MNNRGMSTQDEDRMLALALLGVVIALVAWAGYLWG